MKNLKMYITLLGIGLLCTAQQCKKQKVENVLASIDCKNIEKVSTKAGKLNLGAFTLGDIKYVQDCKVIDLGKDIDSVASNAYTTITKEDKDLSVSFESDVDVVLQTSIENLPLEKIKAIENKLSKTVTNTSSLVVKDPTRKHLSNVIDLLNKDEGLKDLFDAIYDDVQKKEDLYFFVVNQITEGSEIDINIGNTKNTKDTVSIGKYYNMEVSVVKNCKSAIQKSGNVLYDYTPVKWVESKRKIIPAIESKLKPCK